MGMIKRKVNFKRVIGALVVIALLVASPMLLKSITKNSGDNTSENEPLIEYEGTIVSKLYTYGEFLHVEPNLDGFDYDNAYLVMGTEEIKLIDGLNGITISDNLGEGFFLPKLDIGEYNFYIKLVKEDTIENYRIFNDFNFVFYPIKRNDSYKKIEFIEDKFIVNSIEKLPEDVYDIVIDPGHGGIDVGANHKYNGTRYYEKIEVLEVSKRVEKQLTDLGYKVKLTRSDDDYPGNVKDAFADGGRIDICHQAKPKIVISVHLNAHPQEGVHGFEVYSTIRNGAFGDYLIKHFKEIAEPSNNWHLKVSEGSYKRFITDEDITVWQKALEEADEDEKYDLFEVLLTSNRKIDFYFMVRELGGYATDAYEDGRNPDRAANKYRDTIYGIEGVLMEMGYIDNEDEFFSFKENVDSYVDTIVNSFTDYVNNY